MVSRIRSCLNYCFTKLKRFFPRLYYNRVYAPYYLIVHHSIPNHSFNISNMGGRNVSYLSLMDNEHDRKTPSSIDNRETYLPSRVNCEFSQDLSRWIENYSRTNISIYLFLRVIKEFCEVCDTMKIIYVYVVNWVFKSLFSRITIKNFVLEWIITKDVYSRE